MRGRICVAIVTSLSLGLLFSSVVRADTDSYCEQTRLCADPGDGLVNNGYYIGHDEPALLFYSATAGSGNSASYFVTLPIEPSGSAGTVPSFSLYTAFWFGMALCDSQSAPEFTHAECTPDSDSNIFNGSDPTKSDYAGHRPGGAYMELQFYPPANSFQNPPSCDASHWCAAMNVDSFSADQTTIPETFNNFDCENKYHDEPVNFAWVTRSGNATASSALILSSFGRAPVTSDVLKMNPGDSVSIDMSDTPSGFHVAITDFTTGQQGTMVANAAHGFQQVVFDPSAESCTTNPYTFHPMFATSNENTRVWTAHTYNVAFSMEIGHQDQFGYNGGGDTTFSGPSYLHDWSGSLPPASDSTVHPTSVAFPSPLFMPSSGNGSDQYDRVAFEADMPLIEDQQDCSTKDGSNCTNPPSAANFYPIYSAAKSLLSCNWHFGDTQIVGTTNLFGGDAAAEYGAILDTFFPGLGFRFENYRNVLSNNPCEFVPISRPDLFPINVPPNVRTKPQPIPPEEIGIDHQLIQQEQQTLVGEGIPANEAAQFGQTLRDFLKTAIFQDRFGGGAGASGGGT